MKHFKNCIYIVCICSLFSCQSNTKEPSKSIDYGQMAENFCTCMRPLVDLNKEIRTLLNAGKTDEVKALIPQVEQLNKESESCIAKLEEKFGVKGIEQEEKANTAIAKKCPDIAKMIEGSKKLESN